MKPKKFLLLFHFPKNRLVARSPEETQAMYGQWMAWKCTVSRAAQALRGREVA